jgi:hypothetical protein
MKPIFLTFQDDCALLDDIGSTGTHNLCVADHRDVIIAKYRLYREAVRGPGTMKGQMQIPANLKNALAAKYTEGRDGGGAFSYIKQWAKNPGSVSCPYCGRKGLGTIDHYLPQEHFAVFSVYSPNMIPACQACQLNKRSRYSNRSKRPIHPLLDRFSIAQEVIIRTKIHDSGDLGESAFTFSSQSTRARLPRRVRKNEALMLKKHYRFFDLAKRDEVVKDCILELNGLRSRLYDEQVPVGDLAAVRRWTADVLAKTEANQDKDSAPFLREALLRGFLADEHAMMRFARSHVPVTQFTRSQKISMLKKR